MAKIDNFYMRKTPLGYVLQLDWDNERHQQVELAGRDADSITHGLLKLMILLRRESDEGKI